VAKKVSSKKTGKTKKELLDEAIAEAVGAGKELHLESVDFSDPNRPKTCLEVDFPILPINHVAAIEGNAGKPIYQMSKWWARRRSSVFRSMLIAAATKAPDDPSEAAKLVWDSYYGNHQKNEAFQKLKVADIFMGGGTTIVEGARLGMQMYGNDLNPVAWFVVKNELAQVDPAEVQKLLDQIEAEVKPQIMPFYACDCPRGHKGKWTQRSTGKVMDSTFDPLALKPEERSDYTYEGPEVIYTFWSKHGPCQATGCGHRTPIMSSPVIAIKTLTVKAWTDRSCRECHKEFDIEQHEARMAPAALFVCAPDEKPYAVMDEAGRYSCPHCGHDHQDEAARNKGESGSLGKSKNKSVELTLLIHPDWLKGSPGKVRDGNWLGGSATDDAAANAEWAIERQKNLKHIEIRGKLPKEITCPDTRAVFDTTTGTVPKKSTFTCMEATCGKQWGVLDAIKRSSKTGPIAIYAIQGICPKCNDEGIPYSGRFFSLPPVRTFISADCEWQDRKRGDLNGYWPTDELSQGWKTHGWSIPSHGFTHYWTMFNSRQLLVHTQLLKAITNAGNCERTVRDFVLGSFQQFLRNQCMFSFWHIKADKLAPSMSNNNYHPKSNVVEVGAFAPMGYGPWPSTIQPLMDSLAWASSPWELVTKTDLEKRQFYDSKSVPGKSIKVLTGDPITGKHTLTCKSSTEWSESTMDRSI
jgi:putative DNA methylase